MRSFTTSNNFDMATLHWFRNDLRLDDNPALQEALQGGDVALAYVIDPAFWKEDRWGHCKTGPFRTRFLWESVADLQRAIEDVGGCLHILEGAPHEVLPALMSDLGCKVLTAQAEHTPEELDAELAVDRAVAALGGHCRWVEGLTLYHPEDIPMSLEALPDIFTQFRKKVEKGSDVRMPHPAPESMTCLEADDLGELPELASFLKRHGMALAGGRRARRVAFPRGRKRGPRQAQALLLGHRKIGRVQEDPQRVGGGRLQQQVQPVVGQRVHQPTSNRQRGDPF